MGPLTLLQVRTRAAAGWLILAMLGEAAAFVAVRWFFVGTSTGQRLDHLALAGNRFGYWLLDAPMTALLEATTTVSLGLTTAVIAGIAVARGRAVLGLAAVVLIVGANTTAEVLKHAGHRTALAGPDEPDKIANTLPSGHTSVSASVAVALLLVLPPRMRGAAALLGAGFAALTGTATVSVGWHRPSDAVASFFVVAGWASVVGLALALARPGPPPNTTGPAHTGPPPHTPQPADTGAPPHATRPGCTGPPRHTTGPADAGPAPHATRAARTGPGERRAALILAAGGLVLLAVAALGLAMTDRVAATPGARSGRALFVAYAGSAAGISGTAGLSIAVVLATLPRFVPPARPNRFPRGGRCG